MSEEEEEEEEEEDGDGTPKCSQGPPTCMCPEPDESSPRLFITFL
jgi:hypothetical protein